MKSQVSNCNKPAKNVDHESNALQQRRPSRSREVSSRYMFPTVSSTAAVAGSPLNSSISDGLSPLRRSTSPCSNSVRRQKNGGTATVDCTRSVSAERGRPARATAEEVRGDSARAGSCNVDGTRHHARGLWPSSNSTSNSASTLADQLGNERLKRIAGGNDEKRSGPSADHGTRPRRTPADTPRRSFEENAKPVDDERSRRNQRRTGWPSSAAKLQLQGSSLVKSMESLNMLRAGRTLNRAPGSVNLHHELRSSKNADRDYDYLEGLQSIVPARLSADSGRTDPEEDSGGGGRHWRQGSDSSSSEGRSVTRYSDDGGGFTTSRAGGSRKDTARGNYVPARFLQDTLSRLRRLSEANLKQPLRKNGGTADRRVTAAFSNSSAGSNSSAWAMSPGRVPVQSPAASVASMSTAVTTGAPVQGKPSNVPRGLQSSPGKTRGGAPANNVVGRMSNMLNFGMQIFKDKKAITVQEDMSHQLRMLNNRWLQWRFVNARAQAAHAAQISSSQDALYNAWAKMSELRASVVAKRIQLQKAKFQKKLNAVLAAHAVQLEDWATLEREHALAIAETTESLGAAVVRVPLVGGAKADVLSVKQVLDFAVDVMSGIEAPATKLLPQAEKVDSLLSELADTVTQEKALLQECMELLDGMASLQDEERSLRIHLIQLQQCKSKKWNNRFSDLSSNAQ